MSDRKHMKKLREKRVKSIEKQIDKHKERILSEVGRKDTTKDYWNQKNPHKFGFLG